MAEQTPLPPDRSHILTEHRHPRSATLDQKDARGIVDLMVEDHAQALQAVRSGAAALAAFIDDLVPRLQQGGRLIYVGAGTSGRLGVLDAAECPPTFQSDPGQVVGIIAGGEASLRKSSEGKEDDLEGARDELGALGLGERDMVLGIAAGGTTSYVRGAVRIARELGAAAGFLTCAPDGGAGIECDHLIVLRTGPEILTGSTRLKAGTATKLALNIITTAAFTRLGKVYSNLMVDIKSTNQKLADRAIRILRQIAPDLDRAGAAKLLQAAQGELKSAIVMHQRKVDLQAARKLLSQCRGCLREALCCADPG